ncbi:MAG: nitronate monooxygenase [Legionellaceae bacterium]|nr:nitronate monooxygenase [Legionellaceae bacterium]
MDIENTKSEKVCDYLGIQHPIIQAPMAGGATTDELVAAVSNAGGLGSLGAAYMSPLEIRKSIQKIRTLTNMPFAVNLFIPNRYQVSPDEMHRACIDIDNSCQELNITMKGVSEPYAPLFEEQIKVVLEENVPVFSTTFGVIPSHWIDKFKKINTILIGTATNTNEARLLEDSGLDIIIAQGREAGGHRGTFVGSYESGLLKLSTLLDDITNEVAVPVFAAGGIMDGKGIVDALSSSASGVQMGTAFLTSTESGVDPLYKKSLLNSSSDCTVLTKSFSGRLARAMNNKFISRMESKQDNILDFPIQNALTKIMKARARELGNIEFMSMWAGQSLNLCRDISAADLLLALVKETEHVYKNLR